MIKNLLELFILIGLAKARTLRSLFATPLKAWQYNTNARGFSQNILSNLIQTTSKATPQIYPQYILPADYTLSFHLLCDFNKNSKATNNSGIQT